jgi:hypothetical protein
MNRKTTHFRRIGVCALTGTLAVMFSSVGCGGGSGSTGAAGAGGHAGGGSGAAGTTGTGGTTGTAGTTGAGGAAAGTPTAMCQQFVMTLCTRVKACPVPDGGAVVTDVASCVSEQDVAFGCDRATASFATCLSDLQGLSCAGLVPSSGLLLPGSCMDATMNIPLSAAQTACGSIVEVLCDPTNVCANNIPTTQAFSDCVNQGFVDEGCQFAVSTGTTVTQCVNDLCTLAASDGGANGPDGGLPSCNSAINFAP